MQQDIGNVHAFHEADPGLILIGSPDPTRSKSYYGSPQKNKYIGSAWSKEEKKIQILIGSFSFQSVLPGSF